MPSWHEILHEINVTGSTHDVIRRKFIKNLHNVTKRNVIVYYSGWLQKPGFPGVEINDNDKNGFMTVIHGLDRTKGLDLVLHTPGGEIAATEALIDYLKSMFCNNIRAIVPQIAMSGGTMIACACKEIIMGKQSSLGPIDPQFKGIPAHGIVEEFKRAYSEIRSDAAKIPVWQPIIAKYPPAFVGECEKAIAWSNEIVSECLKSSMFENDPDVDTKIKKILEELGDHALTKSHARHLSLEKCKSMGLNVKSLEDDQKLQDAILSTHHSCIHTLTSTPAFKIIENHNGVAFIQIAQKIAIKEHLQ
ncbi:MAG: S49 family peptidase [Spirochaetota bacterium]